MTLAADTFLTREEIARLTGRVKAKAQCAVLRKRRIRFTEDADGWPVVMRAHAEKRHQGHASAPEPRHELDFSGFPRAV